MCFPLPPLPVHLPAPQLLPLAQAAPDASTLFYLTLLLIFVAAIVSAILTTWRKDKCLKLLDGYRVTAVRPGGKSTWGTARVFAQGLELLYARPYTDDQGRRSTSYLFYQPEVEPQCVCLLREHAALDETARELRLKQVGRTFNPGFFRRLWRRIRNFFNLLRDAFAQALTAIIGHAAKARPTAVYGTHSGQVSQIGQTILGGFANAYEPLLEQYIGQPVVVDVVDPATKKRAQLTGYLAEYTAKFIAVLNAEHAQRQTFELALPHADEGESQSPGESQNPGASQPGVEVAVADGRLRVSNTGHFPVVVRSLGREGFEPLGLNVVLVPGQVLDLPQAEAGGGVLHVEELATVDLVAPRLHATVRHAGEVLDRPGLLHAVGELGLVRRK